jgi:FAD/FMN-containing dehydrogenase
MARMSVPLPSSAAGARPLAWRDPQGVFHPRDEAEVIALVQFARANQLQVRTRGARHSIPAAIHTDAHLDSGTAARSVEVTLDRMAAISETDVATRCVTVGAGCHLGADPRDPSGMATAERSLGWHLEQQGWALPDLGGVSHQTVAGFLATGSSGGTLRHAVLDAVIAFRLVDGTGRVHTLSRDADPARFHAALVSLGLLGIMTEVTFRCEPRYDIVGDERCTRRVDAAIDLFSDGPTGLAAALRAHEYLRLMWWPQPGVDKLVVWQARRATVADAARRPAPYVQMPPILGSSRLTLGLAGQALGATAWWRDTHLLRPKRAPRSRVARLVEDHAFPRLYNVFVPVDPAPRPFRASWRDGLPMDDQMDERLMPVTFTELFLPLAQAGEALRRIRALVERDGLRAAGTFSIELYGAKATDAWLSPSFGGDQVRIDLLWTPRPGADPDATWFPDYWDALADLGARPHWGKHKPVAPRALRDAYPRMGDFLTLRDTFDPDAVFLTRHWRTHLGLPPRRPAPAVALPPNAIDPDRTRWHLPALYHLTPTDPSFATRARYRFDHTAIAEAPPEAVGERNWRIAGGRQWYPWFRGTEWPAGPPDTVGAVYDVSLAFLSIRARVLAVVPGRRFSASIEACTLPLAREMLEEVELTLLPGGRTRLRWVMYYDPVPGLGPIHGAAARFFDRLFRDATRNLAASFGPPA